MREVRIAKVEFRCVLGCHIVLDSCSSKEEGEQTRLTPASLEMCMCLKDHLNAQERKQDKSTLEILIDFEEEILDVEVQANEAIPLSDEEIALDAASSEGSMSGPGSRGEEAESKVNYGYNVYHYDY
nr:hypothetical protein [Tanacetum cinerariifolium]